MTRYEQGFLKKCAEYGVDGRVLLKKAQETFEDDTAAIEAAAREAQQRSTPTAETTIKDQMKALYNNALTQAKSWGEANQPTVGGALGGGAAGATALLLHELMRQRKGKDDRKHYLRKALTGLILGGAAGGLGAPYGQQAYNWAKLKAQAAVTRARTAANALTGK